MKLKKIVGWAVVIFLAYYLYTQPSGAAGSVHNVFHVLRLAGSSLATFLNSL
jgi:hypothetical protein